MNKLVKVAAVLAGAVLVGVGGMLAMAMAQPDELALERSAEVAAAEQDVAPLLRDLRLFVTWSPWDERDPVSDKTWSDPSSGEGAYYEWKGNEDVGHGRMTVEVDEPGKVVQRLEFFEPFAGVAHATMAWSSDGGGTRVTWSFSQDLDLMGKVVGLFMDMEAMIGADYDKGLQKLSAIATQRRAEREAREEAAAKAAAEAAAQAAEEAATPAE